MVVFEQLRGWVQRGFFADAAAAGGTVALPLPVNLVLGFTAGALGQAAAVPADLVKVSWRCV